MTIVQTLKSEYTVTTSRNTNLAEKLDFHNATYPQALPVPLPVRAELPAALPEAGAGYLPAAEYAGQMRQMSKAFYASLDLGQKLSNLNALYKSNGNKTYEYADEPCPAPEEIICDLFLNGGAYINADKQGVSDSIRNIFQGKDSKYSLDDMNAMIILSRQRLIGENIQDPNEFALGVKLGYEACAIMALRNGGKLSDAAARVIWNEFNSFADSVTEKASASVKAANQNPFRDKNRGYSPVDGQIISRAVSIMLDASDSGSFNDGIRASLGKLDEMYSRHVRRQIDKGVLDQRYNSSGTLLWHFAGPSGNDAGRSNAEWSIRSSHFAGYFNLPEFALRGNIFGKAAY